jgi:hypothetical protein
MGTYDTYGDVQMKVGDPNFNDYKIGDKTPIPDGAYIAYEGIVVIKDGIFVTVVEDLYANMKPILDGAYIAYEEIVVVNGIFVTVVKDLYTKWGDQIDKKMLLNPINEKMLVDTETLLNEYSPIVAAIREIKDRLGDRWK